MSESEGTRINKYLSEIGFCSRRAADHMIDAGRVKINGAVPEKGTKVTEEDEISVDGKLVEHGRPSKHVYIALNKPRGIVCTTDQKREKNNIVDFVNYPSRIFPIGRLDKLSEGLIFLTNDGDIVNKILRARNNHEKEYKVTVNKPIERDFVKRMSGGIPILGQVTRECKVEQTGHRTFTIVLTQGLNRQIRRMCEYLGYKVTRLQRVRIMNVELDQPIGKWRHLTRKELAGIHQLVEDSEKTEF